MIVAITGPEDTRLTAGDRAALDKFHAEHKITQVVTGGSPGVDTYAEQWALANLIPVIKCLYDWRQYSAAAGVMRDKRMVDLADAVIIFNSPGTILAQQAKSRGRIVVEYTKANDDCGDFGVSYDSTPEESFHIPFTTEDFAVDGDEDDPLMEETVDAVIDDILYDILDDGVDEHD